MEGVALNRSGIEGELRDYFRRSSHGLRSPFGLVVDALERGCLVTSSGDPGRAEDEMIEAVDSGRSWRLVSGILARMPVRLVDALELTLGPDGRSDTPNACARLGDLGPLAVSLGGRSVEAACRRLLAAIGRAGDEAAEVRAATRAKARYEAATALYARMRTR